jgi:hypothetical protein
MNGGAPVARGSQPGAPTARCPAGDFAVTLPAAICLTGLRSTTQERRIVGHYRVVDSFPFGALRQ